MGQRVTQFDDLDENVTSDIETVRFGYDGETYLIDLGLDNRVLIAEFLEPFIEKARKDDSAPNKKTTLRSVGATTDAAPARSTSSRSAAAQARTQRIRDWARAEGHEVKDGGRIKNDIIRAYEDANPDDTLEKAEAADAG
jgi:hypothetical protein